MLGHKKICVFYCKLPGQGGKLLLICLNFYSLNFFSETFICMLKYLEESVPMSAIHFVGFWMDRAVARRLDIHETS